MLTANERISDLEAQVVDLRAALRVAGALPVTLLQAALDQMVDERLLPAETRTEIWGRIREELKAFSIGNAELASGASAAVPRYATKQERAAIHERNKSWSREILRLPEAKDESGQ